MISLSLRALSMHPVLKLDAAVTGATALLMVAGASPLSDLLDLPVGLLVGVGLVLIPYVAYLLWLATREAVPRGGVLLAVGANLAWMVGCVTLLLAGWLEPNAVGAAF